MSQNEDVVVNIGIDFGSSTTKVCYRIQSERIDKTCAVVFPIQEEPSTTLLLNSVLYVSKDLTYMGWKPFKECQKILYFKTLLMKNNHHAQKYGLVKEMCSYYLANVLALSKRYIEKTESKILANQHILWLATFGLPVDQNEPDLESAFTEIINVAVLRYDEAFYHSHISFERWRNFYLESKEESPKEIYPYLIPELLAEVIDVFEDSEVEEGISIIIDIGSATVDIAIVNLDRHSSNDFDSVNFISAKVGALGVDNTVKYITLGGNETSDVLLKEALLKEELFGKVYNLLKHTEPHIRGLEDCGNSLLEKFRGVIAHTCLEAKKTLMGDQLSNMDKLPMYLLGGGNCYYWYKHWPKNAYDARLKKCNLPMFSFQGLFNQPNISMLDKKHYSRFRVASGLTKPETMLKINGYPWHFKPKDNPLHKAIQFHERLENIQKETYGN